MAQGFWRLYKAKVLQTLAGPRPDGALQDEVGWGGVPKMGCPTPLPPPCPHRGFLAGRAPRADGDGRAPRADGGGRQPRVPAGQEGEEGAGAAGRGSLRPGGPRLTGAAPAGAGRGCPGLADALIALHPRGRAPAAQPGAPPGPVRHRSLGETPRTRIQPLGTAEPPAPSLQPPPQPDPGTEGAQGKVPAPTFPLSPALWPLSPPRCPTPRRLLDFGIFLLPSGSRRRGRSRGCPRRSRTRAPGSRRARTRATCGSQRKGPSTGASWLANWPKSGIKPPPRVTRGGCTSPTLQKLFSVPHCWWAAPRPCPRALPWVWVSNLH